MSKLTLSINPEIVERAKEYAKKNGKSLSNIVEEYLKSLSGSSSSSTNKKHSKIVKQLKGSVKDPKDSPAYRELLQNALIEKHVKK